MTVIKKTNVGEEVVGNLALLMGMQISAATTEISMRFLKKLNYNYHMIQLYHSRI
jgi:hypothetical protein